MENEVVKIRDLIELGFPKVITKSHFDGRMENPYKPFEIVSDFYNALYTLSKIYEKYTSKKLELKKHEHIVYSNETYIVYLNNIEVFVCYVSHRHRKFSKSQKLDGIKKIVKELLTTKFNNNLEDLKREFAKVYAEEKAKIELNEIEIYNRNTKFPTWDERVEYENEMRKFIEALKNDRDFAEKEISYIIKPSFFGEKYLLEKSDLRLKNILNEIRTSIRLSSIRIYQNFFIFQTTKTYAVELSEAERQKVLNTLTLLKL